MSLIIENSVMISSNMPSTKKVLSSFGFWLWNLMIASFGLVVCSRVIFDGVFDSDFGRCSVFPLTGRPAPTTVENSPPIAKTGNSSEIFLSTLVPAACTMDSMRVLTCS